MRCAGPGNLSQKGAKTCPHLAVTHREPETKILFHSELEDLLNP